MGSSEALEAARICCNKYLVKNCGKASDWNERSLWQGSRNCSQSQDRTDPHFCEEHGQVQERGGRSPEEEQVQVLRETEDLREQEVRFHQVGQRDYHRMRADGHLKPDGVNCKYMPEHGPLSVWCKTQMQLAGVD